MSLTGPEVTVAARVPAKLNLGLAIVGRRDDGFHDLCSVMQTITLCDGLTLTATPGVASGPTVRLNGVTSIGNDVAIDDPGLVATDNLAVRAIAATLDSLAIGGTFGISIEKGIPAASGMGGGSADAAAAILLTEQATGVSLTDDDRLRVAAALGSDVPFFLTGGTALVTGRGERIEPLPAIGQTSFVIVVPRLSAPIPRKTARLFGALTPDDFTDGADVRRQAARILDGDPIDLDLLGNGFSRALLGLAPELVDIRRVMADVCGQPVALSGAGPTHYVVEPDRARAEWDMAQLQAAFGDRAMVVRCEPWAGQPEIRAVGRPWNHPRTTGP